jgi:hypothetical protein
VEPTGTGKFSRTGPLDGGVSVHFNQQPSLLPFIQVPVNGTIIPILVDTGATNSLIHEETLSQLRHTTIENNKCKFLLANDTPIEIIGSVKLEVRIGNIPTNVSAAITNTLCCAMILGEDWISKYKVVINRATDKVEILGATATVPLYTKIEHHAESHPQADTVEKYETTTRHQPALQGTRVTLPDAVQKSIEEAVEHLEQNAERRAIREILQRNWELFDAETPTIAITSIQHSIPTGDHPPVNSSPYRGSIEQQRALTTMLDQLEKAKQIRPSSSPWSAPVIMIRKKDGEFRFVVDYRKLNAITQKVSYPLPTIESTLQHLAGNGWFSKLDLRSGYFQIPIDERDKAKTAFITTTGLWEFNVLPMGLTNAPPVFQRAMYNLLVKGREDHCWVYLDDILIFSKTRGSHLEHLNEVLDTLNRHRFRLSPKKCSFVKNQMGYLGHLVNSNGMKPLEDNIRAIREMDLPRQPTLKQANEFIGGLGFYRKFIQNFSKIAAPICHVTNLTKQNRHKFRWGEEQRDALEQLKRAITGSELMLDFPDPHRPFRLATDASNTGLGAVLKQVTADGHIKIVYYLSRVLSKAEMRYSTTELEALAMVWALKKLRAYVLGREVEIETDHYPLCQFHKGRSRNGRLDRWAVEMLSEYNITEIRYKKGKCHCDADLLSRYPLTDGGRIDTEQVARGQSHGYMFSSNGDMEDDESDIQPTATINVITRAKARAIAETGNGGKLDYRIPTSSNDQQPALPKVSTNISSTKHVLITMSQIKEEQEADPEMRKRKENLTDHGCVMEHGVLYKLMPRGKRRIKLPWIPQKMIERVLFLYHDHHTAAHLGYNKTVGRLVNKYYWPNLHESVAKHIRACEKCAKHNYRRTKLPGRMNITPTPEEVMGLTGMDFWGPIDPPSRRGSRYVVTLTDYLSKFTFAKATENNSSRAAAEFFLEVCYRYGAPKKLVTDQGTHFAAELTRAIVDSCGTTHILATPYHPMSIAQTERFNATFAPALAKLVNEEKENWDVYLEPVIYAYNTSRHATTSLTPFELMFGRKNQDLMDPKQLKVVLSKPNEFYQRVKRARKILLDHAKSNIQYHSQLAKCRYDRNRPDPQYDTNDLVWVRVHRESSKLDEKYEGPYRIIERKGPATFIVQIENPEENFNPQYTRQVTTSDIKKVYQ